MIHLSSFVEELQRAISGRQAYALFDDLLESCHDDELDSLLCEDFLCDYLKNPLSRSCDVLLCWMADRNFTVRTTALLEVITGFLKGDDLELRRSAALALHSGGPAASEALVTELQGLPEVVRIDLRALLSLMDFRFGDRKVPLS